MQNIFYFDQTACVACNTCRVACKDWNGVRPGPVSWRKVTTETIGQGAGLKVTNLTMSCNHCSEPACIPACPVDAIYKDESTGAVILDRARCENLGECMSACPYGAIDMANEPQEAPKGKGYKTEHPAQKCTMCVDRQAEGKKPICVDACIMRALDFGTKEYLESKYGKLDEEAIGFKRADTRPNYYFKRK